MAEAAGEPFVRGEPLVEVETDKATIVYEAEVDGVLEEIIVPDGGAAELGEPIARLGRAGAGEAPQPPVDERGPTAPTPPASRASNGSSDDRLPHRHP